MNPDNPNFRTPDQWFELCGRLTSQLQEMRVERDEQKELAREAQFSATTYRLERNNIKAENEKLRATLVKIAYPDEKAMTSAIALARAALNDGEGK